MQKIVTTIVGFLLLLVYWSVHDTIDAKLFGPAQALDIKSPDKAVRAIELYPGAKAIEGEDHREHYDAEDGKPAHWQYSWSVEVAQSASVVTDFYQRRMGKPVANDDEEPVFVKDGTRITIFGDPETPDRTVLYIEQDVDSNASSLGWKTRRNIVHFLILGGIAGLCTLGMFVFRTKTEEVAPSVSPPPPAPVPLPEEPVAVNEEPTFFAELETHFPTDWKTRRDRFELTVQRPGKAPVSLDLEPLFYLWKRPGVDRGQAIRQFLDGNVR